MTANPHRITRKSHFGTGVTAIRVKSAGNRGLLRDLVRGRRGTAGSALYCIRGPITLGVPSSVLTSFTFLELIGPAWMHELLSLGDRGEQSKTRRAVDMCQVIIRDSQFHLGFSFLWFFYVGWGCHNARLASFNSTFISTNEDFIYGFCFHVYIFVFGRHILYNMENVFDLVGGVTESTSRPGETFTTKNGNGKFLLYI